MAQVKNSMKKKSNFFSNKKDKMKPYLLLAPAIILLCIFVVYPIINTVYIGLHNWNMISPKQFTGFNNYVSLFRQRDFMNTVRNTSTYTVSVLVSMLSLAVILALFLEKNNKLNNAVRITMFIPHVLPMISVAMIWQWLMEPKIGLLNIVLGLFGIRGFPWLESVDTALFAVILVAVWKSVGYYTLVVLSGLKKIPTSLYEAADLDNANRRTVFSKITLPMLSPQLFFLLVVITIGASKAFTSIEVMTGGGPAYSTMVISNYIYKYAFSWMQAGMASAAGTLFLIVLLILTGIYFKLLGKKVHYQ